MSLRAIILGLILIPVNCYWTTIAEIGFSIGDGSTLPLFVYPIVTIFLLGLLNQILLKLGRRYALSAGELLTIYIMVTIGCSIASESIAEGMFGSIVHPIRHATPENEWKELFFHYLPGWLTINDKDAIEQYYRGESTFYNGQHLRAWLIPLLTWGSLIFALTFIMLCMNVIFRKRWCENEKLAFPIVQLPLAMTLEGSGRSFIRSRAMWIGFGIAVAIDIINGFNYLWPAVPRIPVRDMTIHQYFTSKPWSSIGSTRITPYPFAIGLAFFLPLDLSFSCWFFFMFSKVANIIGGAAGWRSLPRFPYFDEQGSGAWLGLFIVALWISRDHLRGVFKSIISRSAGLDDSQEPVKYRTAFLGLILGSAFVILFTFKAGMSMWSIVLFFGIYFALAIAITRMRAELGATHEIYYVNPRRIMVRTLGTQAIGASSLTIMSMFYSFNRGYASLPMANQMEAFKMGEVASLNRKRLLYVIVLAVFLGIVSSFWANLDVIYRYGAEAGMIGAKEFIGRESFSPLQSWLTNPAPADVPGAGFMGFGFIFTIVLMLMRMQFLWWPFHPAGYALAVSYAMDYFWFPFLVSWAIKGIILKYGGIKAHRQAIPFFLGLILGDYFGGSLWSIIGLAMRREVYAIFI
jgi:hypothetical protein